MVCAEELVNFSCLVNITGNELIQFQLFDFLITDTQIGCTIDANTVYRTTCSWPSDGITMTCDYSVPYQITCNVTVSASIGTNSTQVICSTTPGVNGPVAVATLAVRGGWKDHV